MRRPVLRVICRMIGKARTGASGRESKLLVNWDAVGAIGEIVGATAVVVTLFYLAIQIRETRKEAQLTAAQAQRSAVQASRELRINMFLSERDSPYIPAIRIKADAGEALTAEEKLRLARHVSAMWAYTYSEWVQIDLGLAGEYVTNFDGWVSVLFTYDYVMAWWDAHAETVYPAKFIRFVEEQRRAAAPPAVPENIAGDG